MTPHRIAPRRTILLAMARVERPVTRYQLENRFTKLPKQTIYDWIHKLTTQDLLDERQETKSGRPIKTYELTSFGLFQTAKYALSPPTMDLPLVERIRTRLASKYDEFEGNDLIDRQQRIQDLTKIIREALWYQKAPPGWKLQLQIKADQDGDVRYSVKIG
jgi:DNA-binding PadR family transcriptional regulator